MLVRSIIQIMGPVNGIRARNVDCHTMRDPPGASCIWTSARWPVTGMPDKMA